MDYQGGPSRIMYIYKWKMEAEEDSQKEMCLWMTLSEKASTGYFCFENGGKGP